MPSTLRYALLSTLLVCTSLQAQSAAEPPVMPAMPEPSRPVVRQVEPVAPTDMRASNERMVASDAPGDVTRALFAAQAEGQHAGPGLRLQGSVANAAWRRYLKSFEHPLPPWFEKGVGSTQQGDR